MAQRRNLFPYLAIVILILAEIFRRFTPIFVAGMLAMAIAWSIQFAFFEKGKDRKWWRFALELVTFSTLAGALAYVLYYKVGLS